LGEPFAKALAVFIREVLRAEQRAEAGPAPSWQELPAVLRRELSAEMEKNDELLAARKLQAIEFTEDSPAALVASRLGRVARAKGVSQKELAERLGVSPSFISKVFKQPDRSKVATLRKIAEALSVEVREIV
jgi:DNA-binding phage protein